MLRSALQRRTAGTKTVGADIIRPRGNESKDGSGLAVKPAEITYQNHGWF